MFYFLDILMQGTLNRIPSIENAEIRQFVNGPESFTPDGNFLFGEVPEVMSSLHSVLQEFCWSYLLGQSLIVGG